MIVRRLISILMQTSAAMGMEKKKNKVLVFISRYVALFLACFFLILALIGVVLPGIPTVPFLLLAAWFAARGSERMHRWLYSHPYFGKMLTDWQAHKAISRRSKIIAVSMLLVSLGVMYYHVNNVWILAGITLWFAAVAAYLISRPEPH